MSYTLDTVSTDSYQELQCPGTTQVTAQVSTAAISIGFGHGGTARAGTAVYGADEVLLPVVGGLDRECDAIRIKSYAPGNPAQVRLSAR